MQSIVHAVSQVVVADFFPQVEHLYAIPPGELEQLWDAWLNQSGGMTGGMINPASKPVTRPASKPASKPVFDMGAYSFSPARELPRALRHELKNVLVDDTLKKKYTVAVLKSICKEINISVSGTKEQLLEKLINHGRTMGGEKVNTFASLSKKRGRPMYSSSSSLSDVEEPADVPVPADVLVPTDVLTDLLGAFTRDAATETLPDAEFEEMTDVGTETKPLPFQLKRGKHTHKTKHVTRSSHFVSDSDE